VQARPIDGSERPIRLSVCIPTHHGRGTKLDQLLERLAAEPDRAQIEVCISDNASRDGTAQIVERHRASFGERLHYARNEQNVGWGENLLRAVELACGEYCWLLGSDDAPAPGSIRRLLQLIDEHAGTSGIHLGHLRVTPDLAQIGTAVARESYPSQRVTTRLRGAREVGLASYLTLFLSNNVVHRDRWQRVADAERAQMLEFPLVPHMYMLGRVAAADPDWVWCPELLVISREGDIFLREPSEIGLDTRIVRELIDELDRLWRSLHGSRSYVRRALMFKALRQMATHGDLLQLRMSVERFREHIQLLSLTRHFWWSSEYWRRSLPALLVPIAPLRYASGRPRRRASRRAAAHERNVQVLAELPSAMYTGYATWVRLSVVNRGPAELSSAGPFSAWLACRWENPETGAVVHSGSPTKLWPPLRPQTKRSVEMSITPPPLPGRYRLVIAPVERFDGWYDGDQRASGASAIVNVRPVPGRQPAEIVGSNSAQAPLVSDLSASTAEAHEALPGLAEMTRAVQSADPQWRASGLRERHNAHTLRILADAGFEAARRTAEDASPELHGVRLSQGPVELARAWLREPTTAVLLARPRGARQSLRVDRRASAARVAMTWELARSRLGPPLDALQEPQPNDSSVQLRGQLISEDLATSALELATIAEVVPASRLTTARAIQLGGGYGRLAWLALSLNRGMRYVLVDHPLSLAIAQRYLSEALPQRSFFRFRRFEDPVEPLEELLDSEIAFLTPDQLALLPPLGADLWLSVFSLHGQSREQIAAHFQQADRHVRGWAYTKQWRVSINPVDDVAIEQREHPYPPHWQRVLERPQQLQPDSFEAMFEKPA
jgi:abequosyltransferase